MQRDELTTDMEWAVKWELRAKAHEVTIHLLCRSIEAIRSAWKASHQGVWITIADVIKAAEVVAAEARQEIDEVLSAPVQASLFDEGDA